MDKALAFLAKLNGIASAVSPGTPIAGLLVGTATFVGQVIQDIRRRQQAGEDVTDLLASLEQYSDSVDALKTANAEYWTIPVKQTDPEVPQPEV